MGHVFLVLQTEIAEGRIDVGAGHGARREARIELLQRVGASFVQEILDGAQDDVRVRLTGFCLLGDRADARVVADMAGEPGVEG